MHFQTSRNRVNSRRVRTHEIERTQEMLFADWAPNIIQSNFCAQSGASIRLTIWNSGPVRVGTQGLCHLCLKTLVAPFLPARLTAPGSPRMEEGTWSGKESGSLLECPGDIAMRMKGTGHTAELVVCASVLKLVLLTSIPLNTFE